jgi:hypothetical protein
MANLSAKDRPMNTVKYELKYCERCGTLKLRPVSSATHYCMLCERLLARFRFGKRAAAAIAAGLSTPAEIKILAGIPLSVAHAASAGRLQ